MGGGKRCIVGACACLALVVAARPAAAIIGNNLALKSGGNNFSGARRLEDNGYVGTYITLAEPGDVTITVGAYGAEFGGVAPRMKIAVADQFADFDVTADVTPYEHTFSLSAGTHFVRTEFNNDAQKTGRSLSVATFDVAGATLNNFNTNANALAAADTYVANYRKGPAHLSLTGVAPGTPVEVKLKRHDFRFGTAVGGNNLAGVNQLLNNTNFSNFLLANFNMIVQGNAGKWANNEAFRDSVSMGGVDRFFEYAEQHDLDVRLHNMLWADQQQPTWVNTLLNNANSGNATAKADLRTEISERIDYYVGDGDADQNDGDRARRYVEMDVLNEHDHQPKYWNVYTPAGIADIFNETAAAVTAAGSNARLYLNEYNVLQYGYDDYGNWYREDVEAVTNAGGAVSGVGVQYYPRYAADGGAPQASRIQQVFQNLSVTGLPITLSEFGVQTAGGATITNAGTYLNEAMRMTFGTPGATTFTMWGFWANDVWNQAPLAALMDANWNLTSVGTIYQQLMNQWDTDLALEVGPDGTIDFSGFYGDYEVTIDGETYSLSLNKGVGDYELVIDLPADFNGDGVVDGDDLGVWTQSLEAGDAGADANGDGASDGADFLAWQRQLGLARSQPLAVAAAAHVPEPGAVMLLATAITLAAASARSRHFFSR